MTKFDKTKCIETSCNPIKEKHVSKQANKNIENVNKSKFNVGIHQEKQQQRYFGSQQSNK